MWGNDAPAGAGRRCVNIGNLRCLGHYHRVFGRDFSGIFRELCNFLGVSGVFKGKKTSTYPAAIAGLYCVG